MSYLKLASTILVSASSILSLSGCASITVDDYKGQNPPFDFENFFTGNLEADGFFQDRSGKVIRHIYCKMKATKRDGAIVLSEDFEYSDGKKDHREWIIKKNNSGELEATAGDVKGVVKMQTQGFAFNMKYTLRLKTDDGVIDVNMDDWMYKVKDGLVLNKTKMSKFGIYLGEVTLAIRKI